VRYPGSMRCMAAMLIIATVQVLKRPVYFVWEQGQGQGQDMKVPREGGASRRERKIGVEDDFHEAVVITIA
jgi:hypothetical protein